MRPDDLRQNRHVVAIEKAPAKAEQDQKRHGNVERRSDSHAKDRRNDHAHANGADENASAIVPLDPAIGQQAADDGANDCRGLPVERGGDAGVSLPDAELLA